MTIRTANATIAAGAASRGTAQVVLHHDSAGIAAKSVIRAAAAPDHRMGADTVAQPVVAGALRRDRQAGSDLSAAADVQAAARWLPRSQDVLLTFRIDRTLVPYVAQRR